MNENVKDVLLRALKTFWQATLATLILNAEELVESIPMGWQGIKPVLLSVAAGAIAAGLSAAYNGAIKPCLSAGKGCGEDES